MILIPGQTVTILDTTNKPAGSAIVLVFNAETELCEVLYQYPGQDKPENIPVPAYRLIPQSSNSFIH